MNQSLRAQYLKAMSIPAWQLKSTPDEERFEAAQPPAEEDIYQEPAAASIANKSIDLSDNTHKAHSEVAADLNQSVIPEELSEKLLAKNDDPVVSVSSESVSESVSELDPEIIHSIQSCKLCASRTTRLKPLVGNGNAGASVFIISEPPNAEEDRAGHYLTGLAQTLFQSMLATMDLSDRYFLTGIIKCHSLEQFLVTEQEVNNCAAHLHHQLEQIKPSVILLLGSAPSQMILQTRESFNKLRGKVHSININNRDYLLVVSYHPAFLLRNPLYKKEALKDLIMLKQLLK